MRNGFLHLVLLFLTPISLIGQTNEKLLVEYKLQFYSGMLDKTGVLISDGSTALFNEGLHLDGDHVSITDDGNIVAINKMDDTFNFIDFHENQVISKRELGSKSYIVHEELSSVEWKLIPEDSKMINDFKAYKAVGSFRGRDYVAWYTPEVPSRVGPWKFHGLPGLILEINDSQNKFRWVAQKITYPYHSETAIQMPDTKELTQVDLKDYVALVTEHQLKEEKRRIARAPKGTRVVSSTTQRGVELVYEWEEE